MMKVQNDEILQNTEGHQMLKLKLVRNLLTSTITALVDSQVEISASAAQVQNSN